MVDFTKSSDTNLEEISHTLEDLDSLDMELFRNSFKKSKSSTYILKDSNTLVEEETKKKVLIKVPNADDALSGLLSDEENPSIEKKNLFVAGSKSSLMEDLFKIKTSATSTTSIKATNESKSTFDLEQGPVKKLFPQKQNTHLVPKSNSPLLQSESTQEKTIQTLYSTSKNKEDILSNLIDKSDIVNNKSKRSSLREDLFGSQPHSSIITDTSIQKKNKNEESQVPVQFADYTNTVQRPRSEPLDHALLLSSSKEHHRGRRITKIINDPLGLLSNDLLPKESLELVTSANVSIKDTNTHSNKVEENLPEWLGGTKKLQDKKVDEVKEVKSKIYDEDEKVSSSKKNAEFNNQNLTDLTISGVNNLETANMDSENFSLLYNTHFNQQAALMTMQQQEHELRTATIISQQNEQLSGVSNVQQSMLHNQEKQFNTFLKLQIERQALLEKQIKIQQERINQYIQVLMAQPTSISSTTSIYTNCKSEESTKEKDFINEKQEMESIIKKLELEKSKLESKLSTINEKYSDEMIFEAEFYKKEILFLKETLTRFEERARQEVEFLEIDYVAKLEKLRDEKLQLENQYKEEINNLKREHSEHMEELYKLHTQNTKLLQKEYSDIIENLLKAKHTEEEMIKNITNRKTEIENVLQKANFIFETIKEHREKVDLKENEVMRHEENYLKILEDNIKAQKLEFKNQNNMLVEYQSKFIETTEKQQSCLTQLTMELQKQTMQLNQTHKIFEKNTENILQERDLFEEKMKWERGFLQALKESWMKEQERQLTLLAEERKAIAEEKAQLEVLNKLKINGSDIAKEELETAIKIAQEATASANKEKLKWQVKMNALDVHEQMLRDKENLLTLRAKELENLTQSALIKKEEGIKALKDAKHLESQHRDKLSQLQIQLNRLMEREKNVAIEKYNVTKGRMIPLTYEIEKPERDEPCTSQNERENVSFSDMRSTPQVTSDALNIIDPNLIMLKLNLDNQFDSVHKPFTYPNLL